MSGRPSVRVLLATHNGQAWLPEQLASLEAQVGVSVSLVVSDDASTDDGVALFDAVVARGAAVVLPALPARFGNANRNFMRLIRDTVPDGADYFALCDQDDVWLPGKLQRAVEVMRQADAQAYSADVTAFWPDGRRLRLVKSQRQRPFDHLFESAGAGCTFVFERRAFLEMQRWVTTHFETLQRIKVHDWLLYAFAREAGWRWVIDPTSSVLYRQHERNEAGANIGLRAARKRWRSIGAGDFRRDVLAIGAVTGSTAALLSRLQRLAPADRVWLALRARQCRRALPDALVLALSFLVMPKR